MTLIDNLKNTVVPAGLFFVLTLPQAYEQSGKMFGYTSDTCQPFKTRLLHAVAFFVLMYFTTKNFGDDRDKSYDQLMKYCLYATLLFFVFSSKELFQLTSNFTSKTESSACPSDMTGVAIHTLLFWVALSWVTTLDA